MPSSERNQSLQAWVVCLVASLFFFYEFIQMNMFNTISADLLKAFHLDATSLSRMSSFYFIANVVFLFVAGSLLDRYSTRLVILTSLGVCILGTGLFATAHDVYWATFFRFLTGIGSAFCFLSVIRLATRWFAASHLALVIGLVVTIAMLGGVVSQAPLNLLVGTLGWRHALWVDVALGIFIFGLIFIFVVDYPVGYMAQSKKELKHISELGLWKTLRLAFGKLQNWLGGAYTCLLNLPVIILGGLWGTQYLVKAYGISATSAPYITQMLFFGTIIGSPTVGWISDQLCLRRLPMIVGGLLTLALVLILAGVSGFSFWSLLALFFFIGLCSSSQVLGYPIVAENSIPAITAMSVSVVNISSQGGLAIFEPVFGYLMDWHRKLYPHAGGYLGRDFNWAVWMFPVGVVLALVAVFFLQETFAKPKKEGSLHASHD